jgi:hypothetical protein
VCEDRTLFADRWAYTEPGLLTLNGDGSHVNVKLSTAQHSTRRRLMTADLRRRLQAATAEELETSDGPSTTSNASISPASGARAPPNTLRIEIDGIAEWIGINLREGENPPPFPPPRASPPPAPPPDVFAYKWQCFIEKNDTGSALVTAPRVVDYRLDLGIGRRHLLGGGNTTNNSAPPSPSTDYMAYLDRLQAAGDVSLNYIGSMFSNYNYTNMAISHLACEWKREYEFQNGYFKDLWEQIRMWTFDATLGDTAYYEVVQDAGDRIMEVLHDSNLLPPVGPSCGYRFPGYIVHKQIKADSDNGQTLFDVCFASHNNPCIVRIENVGEMTRCGDRTVYELPAVTHQIILDNTPKFYVKLAFVSIGLGDGQTVRRKLLGGDDTQDYTYESDDEVMDSKDMVVDDEPKKITQPYMACRAPAPDGGEEIEKVIDLVAKNPNNNEDQVFVSEYDINSEELQWLVQERGPLLDEQFVDWIECKIKDRAWEEKSETVEDFQCVESDGGEDSEKCMEKKFDKYQYETILMPTKWNVESLITKCQGAEAAQPSNEDGKTFCCQDSTTGQICLYVNAHTSDDNTDSHLESEFVTLKPRSCDFGYCTNGVEQNNHISPPPPPPYEMPPVPGKPMTPPGIDREDYDDDTFTPTPPQPPSPPPAVPQGAIYNSTSMGCMEQGEDLIVWNNAIKIKAECPDLKKQVLFGFVMQPCIDFALASLGEEEGEGVVLPGRVADLARVNTGTQVSILDSAKLGYREAAEGLTGMRMVKECAKIARLHDVSDPCYTEQTPLIPMDNETLGTLDGATMECKPKHAMQSWRMAIDSRPWYVLLKDMGKGHIEYDCCPLPHSRMCAERHTECEVRADGGIPALAGVAVTCSTDADEVLTGWRVTSDGCEEGMLKVVAHCCSAEPPLRSEINITEDCECTSGYVDGLTGETIETNEDPELSEDSTCLCSVYDETAGVDRVPLTEIVDNSQDVVEPAFQHAPSMSGPLIDSIVIEEGASTMWRELASNEDHQSWPMSAFDSAPLPEGSCGTVVRRDAMKDLFKSLRPCRSDAEELHLDDAAGNVFMRVGSTFGVGFYGYWNFKIKTHAFKGVIMLTKRTGAGDTVVNKKHFYEMPSLEEEYDDEALGREDDNFPFKTQRRLKSTIGAELSPGVYTLWVYAAYNRQGEMNAQLATMKDTPDRVLFSQESHCNARLLVPFTEEALSHCGGNEERHDYVPDTPTSSLRESEEDEAPPSVDDDEDLELMEGVDVTETLDDANPMLNEPDFNGGYFDLRLELGLSGLNNSHLMAQGVIVFLGITVTIDININPGAGGDMWAKFLVDWVCNGVQLGTIRAESRVITAFYRPHPHPFFKTPKILFETPILTDALMHDRKTKEIDWIDKHRILPNGVINIHVGACFHRFPA